DGRQTEDAPADARPEGSGPDSLRLEVEERIALLAQEAARDEAEADDRERDGGAGGDEERDDDAAPQRLVAQTGGDGGAGRDGERRERRLAQGGGEHIGRAAGRREPELVRDRRRQVLGSERRGEGGLVGHDEALGRVL